MAAKQLNNLPSEVTDHKYTWIDLNKEKKNVLNINSSILLDF